MPKPKNYKYGGVQTEECEVTVTIDKETGIARVCSTWPAYSRKLELRYGPPKSYQEREGWVTVAFWEVPARVIRFGGLEKRKGGAGNFDSAARDVPPGGNSGKKNVEKPLG